MVKLSLAPDGPRVRVCATVLGAALLVTACQTPAEPRIVTKEVAVPVAKSCIPKDFRDPPVGPDTDAAILAAPGPGELLQLLAAGREIYLQWIKEARPVISGCR